MSSISGAVGSYYGVKNTNAAITAQAALQKLSQETMKQQMRDLIQSMPRENLGNRGRVIDIYV
jgi:hypothetical protein